MTYQLFQGDCLEVMRGLPDNSVDSVCTDPPYGLKFMGNHWDCDVPSVDVWREVFRVLKPGGHLLSFSGTRTYHRMVVNIEDAGFEIRDQIMWVYGSGFPKSLDVSKAIDKAAGAEGGYGEKKPNVHSRGDHVLHEGWKRPWQDDPEAVDKSGREYLPATPEAEQWQGWGTALKPAHEPICVARKPLSAKTVAANVLLHATGALNIDACRVPLQGEADAAEFENNHRVTERLPQEYEGQNLGLHDGGWKQLVGEAVIPTGRWPANLIHDGSDEVVNAFPNSGNRVDSRESCESGGTAIWGDGGNKKNTARPVDFGGTAARFFYAAKASKKDRNTGCEGVMSWGDVDLNEQIHSVLSHLKATSEIITPLLVVNECGTTLFGSSTSAIYPQGTTYITKTVSKLITELTTSNFCQNSTTRESILVAIKTLLAVGLNLAENVEHINQSIANITSERTVSALGAVAALLRMLSEISKKGRLGNAHSTVKPKEVCRWLQRLVTPPGGTTLDLYCGSGSFGVSAVEEGFHYIGIDRDQDADGNSLGYLDIARARIGAVTGEDLV